MRRIRLAMMGALAGSLFAPTAGADELELAPRQVAVLPDDASGSTRVALDFDLSGLREGPGRKIDQALLVWTLSGLDADSTSAFEVREVTAAWVPEAIEEGEATLVVPDEATDLWDVTPLDVARTGEALVRFDVRDLVEAWASGAIGNHGVLILTPHLTPEAMRAQIPRLRLHVWYGFGEE